MAVGGVIVASRMVPLAIRMLLRRRWSFTAFSSVLPRLWRSSRWRNLRTVVSSGAPSTPRSMPTKVRIATESYSSSSGSDRSKPLKGYRRPPAVLADIRIESLKRRRHLWPGNEPGPCPPETAPGVSVWRTSQRPSVSAAASSSLPISYSPIVYILADGAA
jgi:hypothetical protein